MSLIASAGASGRRGTSGRRPKGGVPRAVVQSKLPEPLRKELFRLAATTDLSVSDLAGFYLVTGWNQIRKQEGLAAIPMPEYLVAEIERAREASPPPPGDIQDFLFEEPRLAS